MIPYRAWLCLQRDALVNNEICALCWSKQTTTFQAIQGITARTRAECAAQNKVDSREKDLCK